MADFTEITNKKITADGEATATFSEIIAQTNDALTVLQERIKELEEAPKFFYYEITWDKLLKNSKDTYGNTGSLEKLLKNDDYSCWGTIDMKGIFSNGDFHTKSFTMLDNDNYYLSTDEASTYPDTYYTRYYCKKAKQILKAYRSTGRFSTDSRSVWFEIGLSDSTLTYRFYSQFDENEGGIRNDFVENFINSIDLGTTVVMDFY